jgi:hypothetical protein
MIQLSTDESATAKQIADKLKTALERKKTAEAAWGAFHDVFKASHPIPGNFRFTADCKLAYAESQDRSGPPELREALVIELNPAEMQKLQNLHKELTESQESLSAAQSAWWDYERDVLSAHLSTRTGSLALLTLGNKQLAVPAEWGSGILFTPDFRLALPKN